MFSVYLILFGPVVSENAKAAVSTLRLVVSMATLVNFVCPLSLYNSSGNFAAHVLLIPAGTHNIDYRFNNNLWHAVPERMKTVSFADVVG